jgi:hypothetical protein
MAGLPRLVSWKTTLSYTLTKQHGPTFAIMYNGLFLITAEKSLPDRESYTEEEIHYNNHHWCQIFRVSASP